MIFKRKCLSRIVVLMLCLLMVTACSKRGLTKHKAVPCPCEKQNKK